MRMDVQVVVDFALQLSSCEFQLFYNQYSTILKPKRNQFIGKTFTSHKAVDPT